MTTNESNEAYERRMAIKELMSAPQGTRFISKPKWGTVWADSDEPGWNFSDYEYRIAPIPKKVLRPAWEILRDEAARVHWQENAVSIYVGGLGHVSFAALLASQGMKQEELNSQWPPEWFTTEEPKR